MPDPLNNSFIPKRGPVGNRRAPATRQVYVFTILSYMLMFATLIAVGGVFIYEKYLEQQLDKENELLFNDIKSFNKADMEEVLDFDGRLQQANSRLDKSVSLISVFEALEASTAETIKIDSLNIERMLDDKLVLEAEIQTDSFDSALFQRKAYGNGSIFSSVAIEELNASGLNPNIEISEEGVQPKVIFKAELEVPVTNVPYVPNVTSDVDSSIEELTLPTNVSTSSANDEDESENDV